jgi:hypothetical protein
MTHFKEKPEVHGGQRLQAQFSPRVGLLCSTALLFPQLFAAANFDPVWGIIRRKVTPAATGLPLHRVHRLLFIGEV